MLSKGLGIKPHFSSLGCMAMREDFALVFGGDFIPFPDMFIIACLLGLGALFVMETEEGAIFLQEIGRKRFQDWDSFLATEETGLGEVLCSGSGFNLLLFAGSLASRSSGGGSFGLDFPCTITSSS